MTNYITNIVGQIIFKLKQSKLFALQNEVRKEKYWRKRNPPLKGFVWRETQGYDKSKALATGAFSLIPDWSNESGEYGAPTPLQERIMEQNLRLINEVYEAASIVKNAQEYESSAVETSASEQLEPKTKQ